MFWKNKVMVVNVQKGPVLSAEKLLETFAVDPETPWLTGALSVLAGMEELAKESVAICELTDAERAFHSGGLSKILEIQERILDLVKKGNDTKRGLKTDSRSRIPEAGMTIRGRPAG